MSYDSPAHALLLNHDVIRKALEFHTSRLKGIIDSDVIKLGNEFVRKDTSEYLSKSEEILANLPKQSGEFDEWYMRTVQTLSENEKFIDFILSLYKKYLELSEDTARRNLNFHGIEDPGLKFENLNQQIARVERASQYIKDRNY